jgi:thiosulfate/3-mercaptopyruvate sulfurtransferase
MYKLTVHATIFVALFVSMFAFAQPESLQTRNQLNRAIESLVEVAQIASVINANPNGVVILDVRTPEEYAAGHWPNSIQVSYDQWEELSRNPQTGLTHEQAWHERIGALGIDADDTVLVYDNGKMTQAARVWFVLQHFGVARAAVVNGGFPLIETSVADADALLSTRKTTPDPVQFVPSSNQSERIGNMDRFEVKAAIERGEAQILDARSNDEYRGIDLRKNNRGGHLPTARNIPHTRLLDEQGRLRPIDELADLLDEAGFVKGRPVITHCDGGGRAALAALAAARAGYGPVINYYLSFGDWAKDATCPIVTPE